MKAAAFNLNFLRKSISLRIMQMRMNTMIESVTARTATKTKVVVTKVNKVDIAITLKTERIKKLSSRVTCNDAIAINALEE